MQSAPPPAQQQQQAAPVVEGPVTQAAPPSDLPHPARTPIAPIAPPLSSPQPSWKQEFRAPDAGTPGGGDKPENK
jgi:hypothetical protein